MSNPPSRETIQCKAHSKSEKLRAVGNLAGNFCRSMERELGLNQRLQLDLIIDDFTHVLDFMKFSALQVFSFLTKRIR